MPDESEPTRRFEDRLLEVLLERHASVVSQPPKARVRLGPSPSGRVLVTTAAAVVVAAGVLVAVDTTGMAHQVGHGTVLLDAKTLAVHTGNALTAANQCEVENVKTVLTDSSGQVSSTIETWSYEGERRVEVFGANGQPVSDESYGTSSGSGASSSGLFVNYGTDSWSSITASEFFARSSPIVFGSQPQVLKALIHAQQASGFFNSVTDTTLDGQPALELSRTTPAGASGASSASGDSGASGTSGSSGASGDSGASGSATAGGGPSGATAAHAAAQVAAQRAGATGPTGESGASGATSQAGVAVAAPNNRIAACDGFGGAGAGTRLSGSSGASGESGTSGATGPTGAQRQRSSSGAAAGSGPSGSSGATGVSGSSTASGPAVEVAPGRLALEAASLASSAAGAGSPVVLRFGVACPGTSWTIWVDPTSYLPLQSVTTEAGGGTSQTSFEWSTPDAADLAQLVAPVPAGFSQSSTAVQPNSQQDALPAACF